MEYKHNFDKIISRRCTDSGKWNMFPEEFLPMWVADSDFACPEPIINALKERIDHQIFGYPIVLDRFKNSAKYWFETYHACKIAVEAVVYLPTLLLGMMECLYALTNEHDEIAVFSPQYTAFFEAIENTGRKKALVHLKEENGRFNIDFKVLEQVLARKTVTALFLCNPHNPTGQVWTYDDLVKISQLCLAHNVIIISDDIYADVVFTPNCYTPIININEKIKNQSVLLINPSKVFNIAGLRAAAAIIHNTELREKLVNNLAKKKTAEPNILGMIAFEAAYTKCAWFVPQLLDYLEKNILYAMNFFQEKMPKISFRKPEATFLLWIDCRKLFSTQEEVDFFMKEQAKILVNSGAIYGVEGQGFVRMNIAVPKRILEEALNRIYSAYQMNGFHTL